MSVSPKFNMGVNVLETLAFQAAQLMVGNNATYIPIHIDANFVLNPKWALNVGIVYRYENYGYGNRPIYFNGGDVDWLAVWSNYHELFLMAGPRYSPSGNGLDGFYLSFKAGAGYVFRTDVTAITFVSQPELGYSWVFGSSPGFYLGLGGGLLANIPIYEKPYWGYENNSTIGYLVHRFIPIFNLTLGFTL